MIDPISFYGWPFFISLGSVSVLCYLLIRLQSVSALRDKRSGKRHIHKRRISRFGGIAIISGFIITLAINEHLVFDHIVWSMLVGGAVILIFGVIDDIRVMNWKSQIFAQIVVVLLVFIMGVRIEFVTNPFGGVVWLIYNNMPIISLIFTLVWIGIIMNAINWCDGIDGLVGGVVFIAAITLFIISLQPHVAQPPIAIISIVFAGSVAGFLIFNLPPARIFAGSSGSFFMGFIIALIAIAAGAKIGATLLVLAVPLIDAMWVVGDRFRSGNSIFHGDKKHLHHRLLDRGWSTLRILVLYYVITVLCAIVAIVTHDIGKFIALVIFCGIILIFFIVLSYKNGHDKTVNYI